LYFFDGAVTTPIEEACRIGITGISLHRNYLRCAAADGLLCDPG
jgi:hypothetical protein